MRQCVTPSTLHTKQQQLHPASTDDFLAAACYTFPIGTIDELLIQPNTIGSTD